MVHRSSGEVSRKRKTEFSGEMCGQKKLWQEVQRRISCEGPESTFSLVFVVVYSFLKRPCGEIPAVLPSSRRYPESPA